MKSIIYLTLLMLAALACHAGTSPRVWTSKANTNNTVTARLVSYKDGVLRLKDGAKIITVNEISLSDVDRAYLLANCNPYVGLTESQCDGITERQPPKTPEQEFAEAQALIEALKKGETDREAKIALELSTSISCNTCTGTTGAFYGGSVEVNQIVTTNCALITYWHGRDSRQAFLEGYDYSKLADGCKIRTPGKHLVASTRSYETALGSKRTLHVIIPAP